MASQYQPQPPSATATPRPGWWSRPIVTFPAADKYTCKECTAYMTPCIGSLFTVIAVLTLLTYIDHAQYQPKFSIQSINVSPSTFLSATDTWHVDFLVENPSSRYSIYFDIDGIMVRLGSQNAAVLSISRVRGSRDLTTFSLVFLSEERRNNVVAEQLDVMISGQHKLYAEYEDFGHFNVRCRNLNRSHENIICQSSFITCLCDIL